MACAPSDDSDQPGHPPSLIRVFAVRMKKAWVLSYPLSAQRRLWSDWADAQADLSLRWAHMPFCWFCHEAAYVSETEGQRKSTRSLRKRSFSTSFTLFSVCKQVGDYCQSRYYSSFELYYLVRAIRKGRYFNIFHHSDRYIQSRMLSFLVHIFGVRATLFSSKPLRQATRHYGK